MYQHRHPLTTTDIGVSIMADEHCMTNTDPTDTREAVRTDMLAWVQRCEADESELTSEDRDEVVRLLRRFRSVAKEGEFRDLVLEWIGGLDVNDKEAITARINLMESVEVAS